MVVSPRCILFFFFNDTATTEIYTLSLHDALPICRHAQKAARAPQTPLKLCGFLFGDPHSFGVNMRLDRKSTRLNSSHGYISYAVFCLKKKKQHQHIRSDKFENKNLASS